MEIHEIQRPLLISVSYRLSICMLEKRFLSRVDTTREPIKRTVQTVIRLKAQIIQPKQKGRSISITGKTWQGVDFRNIPINPGNHTIGVYTKQVTRPHINDLNFAFNDLDIVTFR
jgi:hypothetical protein